MMDHRVKNFVALKQIAILSVMIATTVGCSGTSYELSPVSGRVTLDGKPLANAKVVFLPQASDNPIVGPSSCGVTDEQGHFTVKTMASTSQNGAVVGAHVVFVSTFNAKTVADAPGNEREVVLHKETMPPRYSDPRQSELKFVVPVGGTSEADFILTTNY